MIQHYMGRSQVSNHADTPLISLRNDPKSSTQILVKKQSITDYMRASRTKKVNAPAINYYYNDIVV